MHLSEYKANINSLINHLVEARIKAEYLSVVQSITPDLPPPVDPPDDPPPDLPPPVGTTVNVGPAGEFKELHAVPFSKLQSGTVINLVHRAQPYASKIVIQRDGVTIKGIPASDGTKPVVTGVNAEENQDYDFWTGNDEPFYGKGVIQIIAEKLSAPVQNPRIEGLRITGAKEAVPFAGRGGVFKFGAAGVYMTTCENPQIVDCEITGNDNGILVVTNAGWPSPGVTSYPAIVGNKIWANGVVGSDRCHNTYVEAVSPRYQFNEYGAQVGNGALLKDRSAGAEIIHNVLRGPSARYFDLVEPEAGVPFLTSHAAWGRDFVGGNVLENFDDCSLIHFGYDGTAANARRELYVYHNTLRNTGDNWKTFWFKMAGGRLVIFNNVFWNDSTDAIRMYNGIIRHDSWACGNWWTVGTSQTSDPANWATPLDPGFAGWNGKGDGANHSGVVPSPKGIVAPLDWITWTQLPQLTHGWNGSKWVPRSDWTRAGASE